MVAALAVFSLLTIDKSIEARDERTVARVIEEYGFRLYESTPDYVNSSGRRSVRDRYVGATIDEGSVEELVKTLQETCRPHMHGHRYYDMHGQAISDGDGDPWREVYVFVQTDLLGSWTSSVVFVPYNKRWDEAGYRPSAYLAVHTYEEPTLKRRIKDMLRQ